MRPRRLPLPSDSNKPLSPKARKSTMALDDRPGSPLTDYAEPEAVKTVMSAAWVLLAKVLSRATTTPLNVM